MRKGKINLGFIAYLVEKISQVVITELSPISKYCLGT